jgi:hypothetical protein
MYNFRPGLCGLFAHVLFGHVTQRTEFFWAEQNFVWAGLKSVCFWLTQTDAFFHLTEFWM